MQSVEIEGLDQILARWEGLLQRFPSVKAELLERLGKQMLEDVRRNIGGSGKVQGWQERYIGSKNGYAAVRPRAGTFQTTKGGKQYAAGYITNAIENGHRVRTPRPSDSPGYHYTRGRNRKAAAAARREPLPARLPPRGFVEPVRRAAAGAVRGQGARDRARKPLLGR